MKTDDFTYYEGMADALDLFEQFLDTLSEEPDKGLDVTDFCKPIDPGIAQCVADHWWEMLDSKEPDKSLEEEVKNYFQGYWPGTETVEQCNTDLHFTPPAIIRLASHFAEWQKEQMLKDAVEGCVTTNLANRPVIYLDQLQGYQFGDKVRIIVLKDESK